MDTVKKIHYLSLVSGLHAAGENNQHQMNTLTKLTVEIYEIARIKWAKANPAMLTRRQRNQALLVPESFGAMPTYLFTNRESKKDAERDALPYRNTGKYFVRIA